MLRAGRYSGYETGANHFVSARSPRLPALAHSDGTLGRVSAFHAAAATPLYHDLVRMEAGERSASPVPSYGAWLLFLRDCQSHAAHVPLKVRTIVREVGGLL